MRFLWLLIFFWVSLPLQLQADTLADAEADFKAGRLAEGRSRLLDALHQGSNVSPVSRARILNRLAVFYEIQVGSPSDALRFSRQVSGLPLGKDHPEGVQASRRIARVKQQQEKYVDLRSVLKTLDGPKATNGDARSQVKQLTAMLRQQPSDPYVGQIHYHLGIRHDQLGNHWSAYRSYRRCLDLLPGINFLRPVAFKMEKALDRWVKSIVLYGAYSVLGGIIALTAGLLIKGHAWRHLETRHIYLLAGALGLWSLFFYAVALAAGSHPEIQIPPVFDSPIFGASLPGKPGSAIITVLYLYGVMALMVAYGLHLGLLRFEFSLTGAYVQGIAGLMVFCSVFSLFFYRHCHNVSVFSKHPDKPLAYLSGYLHFPVSTTVQNVMTNPRAYPGASLENIDEPEVRAWINNMYDIIEKDSNPGTKP